LILIPRYWPHTGGAELHTRRLAAEMRARGARPTVVRICGAEPRETDYAYPWTEAEQLDDDGVAVIQPGAPRAWRPLLRRLAEAAPRSRLARGVYGRLCEHLIAASLRPIAREHDVVHAVYNGFTPLARAAARLGKPFVFTPLAHTHAPEGEAWSSPSLTALYARADALIAMTAYESDWLAARRGQGERHVVPMAPLLDPERPCPDAFRARHGLGEDPIVLFLGRLSDSKGYGELAEAMRYVRARRPEARLVFVGPASDQAKARLAGLKDLRLHVLGALSGAQKNAALAAADLVAVPSTQESLGVVYLEAWSFAKPVIAADIPVMRSVISHGEDGLLADPSPTPLARAVLDLLNDPERAAAMGRAGAQKTARTYDWARAAQSLLDIYAAQRR
jgi:glycosyltransferase involved in cell wall biosynthesis